MTLGTPLAAASSMAARSDGSSRAWFSVRVQRVRDRAAGPGGYIDGTRPYFLSVGQSAGPIRSKPLIPSRAASRQQSSSEAVAREDAARDALLDPALAPHRRRGQVLGQRRARGDERGGDGSEKRPALHADTIYGTRVGATDLSPLKTVTAAGHTATSTSRRRRPGSHGAAITGRAVWHSHCSWSRCRAGAAGTGEGKVTLLRGLTGRVLPCGCLVGVYETYAGKVIGSIDARGCACDEHRLHQDVSAQLASPPGVGLPSRQREAAAIGRD